MRCVLLFPLACLLLGHLPALGQAAAPPATDNAAWLESGQRLPLARRALSPTEMRLQTLFRVFPLNHRMSGALGEEFCNSHDRLP
jgi:hypothetical protein